MRSLILLCTLLSSLTFADGTVFNKTTVSDDTDDNSIIINSTGFWYALKDDVDYGLSFRHSKYEADDSQRIGFLYDKRFENRWGVNLDLGVETLYDEITGKATISRWHNKGSFELFFERNFIDNVIGTQNGVTYTSSYALKEYHLNDTILVGIVGLTDYSDDVQRKEGRFVLVQPLNIEGLNFRLETQYYEFDEFSRFYFSPNEYIRGLAGFQYFRQHRHNFYSRIKALYGRQRVNGFDRSSYLGVLTTGYEFDTIPLQVAFNLTFDQKEPAYTYKFAMLELTYRF